MSAAKPSSDQLFFKMHPRVLEALGRDLVTNDIVAVIELVKNSYDALATRVDVRFGNDSSGKPALDIVDDGYGMDRETIEDVWCVVATPHRMKNPKSGRGKTARRVTGEKGLGRLSAARLGAGLELVTKSPRGPLLKVTIEWAAFALEDKLDQVTFPIELLESDEEIGKQGTRLRITDLSTVWTDDDIEDLEENLARLLSPFSHQADFRILLTRLEEGEPSHAVEIESPTFLSKPKYAIRGHVAATGRVRSTYEYQPIRSGKPRRKSLSLTWSQIYGDLDKNEKSYVPEKKPGCGAFEFEVRAWDLSSDATMEISERFDIAKSSVRHAIRAHKGISLYRDEILVLPKSDAARDWLGLDLRRVSRVGTRLSTSQIVGYVQITKEKNPRIGDTSDRERLTSNRESRAFQEILKAVVNLLEGERDQDRRKPVEPTLDLFEDLSAEELLAEMIELAEEGGEVRDALPTLREFNKNLDRARIAIKQRFTYYSRLATIGTIAQMLVHEIRNQTTLVSRVLRKFRQRVHAADDAIEDQLEMAEGAITSLEQLADTFLPLASRGFRKGKRNAILEHAIQEALTYTDGQIENLGVRVPPIRQSETSVGMDPGLLVPLLVNLITNALYWLSTEQGDRRLAFRFSKIEKGERIRVSVDDSGPGVSEEDADRIFWPGVTRKPQGIGMGLTVASELVAEHGGRMALVRPGRLGGATFQFDLPLAS